MDIKLLTLFLLFGALQVQSNLLINLKVLSENPSKLPLFVCRIVNDVNRQNINVRNIAIVVMKNEFRENIIDETVQCMPKSKVSVNVIKMVSEEEQMKLNENYKLKENARNADMIIMVADRVQQSQLLPLVSNLNNAHFFNYMSKFLIVTPNSQEENRNEIATMMTHCSILNYGIIFEVNENPHVEVRNQFMKTTNIYTNIQRNKMANTIFPDKLRNLNGYKYKAYAYENFLHSDKVTGEKTSKYLYFLKSVAEIQNATVEVKSVVIKGIYDFIKGIGFAVTERTIDVLLNAALRMNTFAPKLLTYEENSFCALIPEKSQNQANKESLKIQKIDKAKSYIGFTLTLTALIVWRLYKNRGANNSHWRFLFAIWASSFGQTVKFRKCRLVLTIMLQICITMNFVRGMLDITALSSYLTASKKEPAYKTFVDLAQSNENFSIDPYFTFSMSENQFFELLEDHNRMRPLYHSTMIEDNSVIIIRCNLIELIQAKLTEKYSYELLAERITHHYNNFEAGFLNPFIDRLQEYMTWSFQGGLLQKWEQLYNLKAFGTQYQHEHDHSNDFLTWKGLRLVFVVLLAGHFCALIALMCEIFYHDIVSQFSFAWIRAKFTKMARKKRGNGRRLQRIRKCLRNFINRIRFSRKRRQNVANPRVRFLNVRPIDV